MFLFGDPTEDDIDTTLKSSYDYSENRKLQVKIEGTEEMKKTDSKDELNNSFDGECLIF